MFFKRSMCLILVIVMSFSVFAGCGFKSNEKNQVVQNIQTEFQPFEIIDQVGRKVTISNKVERIISSYYISTAMLIALNAKDKLVGIEIRANERELYKKAAPELLDLPGVGSGRGVNIEECVSLNPDLVIIPYRLKDSVEKFEVLNIPVIVVSPESMEEFLQTVEILGKAIGEEQRAKKFINYYRENINMVEALTKDIENRPDVYIAGSGSPLTTVTSQMYQDDLIKMAGGNNVSSEIKEGHWTTISIEELIKWSPDYIYSVDYAGYDLEEILNDSRLQTIDAVKNKKVYSFPSKIEPWDFPAPSSILGVLWLLNSLHPQLYSTEQFKSDAKEFYNEFFNIDITTEDMGLYINEN